MRDLRLLLLTVAVAFSWTAVFAQEQKAPPKDEKHVFRLETDSGRYGASAERLDPKLLGVAIYPGARVDERENEGKGANLALDWGTEGVRLYVQKYVTSDPADKVLAFYRKQLSKYGAVLECRDGKPAAKVDSELKCDGDKDSQHEESHKGLELKAGTENKQHVVGVTPRENGTDFQVIYVEHTKRGEI